MNNGYNGDRGGGFKKSIYQYELETRKLIAEYEDLESAARVCKADRKALSKTAFSINNICNGYL
ncbi:hypothetical protein [uncultured Nonlabens sp.]|uniref:hypothetical protein n=1 Tax=uncultured Nonlabens sp. TaxID=859306 RepID=UPI00260C3784|nr:hypothetical protein [uncultured Nonlabens sp.]